ncbi:MAG: endonuclease III [Candidatus Omnitrophica bacterium]|nr:endonuclease III [Candidatus Omnitrophota bacterium]MDD5310375.1 endonuclease III [Candidatus Omnitrophota bacterium]MDD5545920.1 endonuclease III [Candidatus Omnitrophota bacterium]
MRRDIPAVIRLLRRRFGRLRFRREKDAVGLLVKTILSQNTSDVTSFRAFDNLKKRFRSWERLRKADVPAIRREIKIAGLSNIKASRIKYALDVIFMQRGSLELDFLGRLDIEAGYGFLRSIKGVGPKTAAIVLLFGFNKPVMPVDTHIFRVTKRLGLIGGKMTPEKAQEYLTAETPADAIKEFHVHLIMHGRQVCTARDPKCPVCNLKQMCKYYGEKHGREGVNNRK